MPSELGVYPNFLTKHENKDALTIELIRRNLIELCGEDWHFETTSINQRPY